MHSRLTLSSIALTIATACAAPGATAGESVPIIGRWGGLHADLMLSDTGGTIDYDCARGLLRGSVRPDANGRFDVAGVHIRGHGGPVRVAEPIDSLPARYEGVVSGNRLTLRVIVQSDSLGPFALTRDSAAQLTRCY